MNHPYLPLTDQNRYSMLQHIGVNSFDELLVDIPNDLRLKKALNLPNSMTEIELVDFFSKIDQKNVRIALSFIGAGAYHHHIPAVIDHIVSRSEFYTAYTPYQPEISQGILQAIFEYQTYVAELFGLPVANASLYDGPTALAEAVLIALKEQKSSRLLIPETISPHLLDVLKTYTRNFQPEFVTIPSNHGIIEPSILKELLKIETAAVVIQNPNFFGYIEDLPELLKTVKNSNAISICYVHPLILGILESPGHYGADMVVGEGQPLGLPVAYGGPYLGLMAVSERFMRKIPGRLVGETVDHHGKRAFVLTLQTREQHIRREKATSNICSNQALCALRAAIYLSVIGPKGFNEIAQRAIDNSHYLCHELKKIGLFPLYDSPFFMEFPIKTPRPATFYIQKLMEKGILAGFDLGQINPAMDHLLLVCATEIFSKEQLDSLVAEMRCLL